MADENRLPPHLRSLPPALLGGLTEEDKRAVADVHTHAQRIRRASESADPNVERWAFPVPRPAALLFDAMERAGLGTHAPCSAAEALRAGEETGLDAEAAREALLLLQRHELATVSAAGVVLHPEAKCWF